MKERIIIIFVAIIAGLFITSAGFFIYQSTQAKNDTPLAQTANAPEEEQQENPNAVFVRISEPADESLTTKRTLVVKGNTNPGNIIVVSTNIEDVEAIPTREGDFSVSIDIDAGANPVITRAIAPDGTSSHDIRTVTYSTEEF